MTIRVGVVIPVFNDWEGLQRCLRALAVQTYPAPLVQVRVVDNDSNDWPAYPGFPMQVEVICHRRPGSYGARNRAALNWDVDLLAFTDADCRPDPQWLERGVEAVLLQCNSAPFQAGLVAGRIVLEASNPVSPTYAELLDQILGFDQDRTVRRAGFAATANLFVSKDVFTALGGFKSHTRSGGDRDFCERARAQKLPIHYCRAAVVSHPCRNWDELQAKQRRIVGGRLSLADPHPLARMRVLVQSVRPIFSESLRVWLYKQVPLNCRFRLQLLVLQLRWYVFCEWARLQRPSQKPLR